MQVTINGEVTNLDKSISIDEVLNRINVRKEHGFAVALNDTVITKNQFAKTFLKEGDQIEIIQATAGG